MQQLHPSLEGSATCEHKVSGLSRTSSKEVCKSRAHKLGGCNTLLTHTIRAACLQNETAPEKLLNRYENGLKNAKKDPKSDPKRDR